MRSKLLRPCALVLLFWLSACGQNKETVGSSGQASGTACPADSDLTYDTFAASFMRSYCTRCHSASLRSADRQGAPSDHNFDTLQGLRATAVEHLDEQAAAGPDAVNDAMPPTAPKPTEDERRKLGEWLACGMP